MGDIHEGNDMTNRTGGLIFAIAAMVSTAAFAQNSTQSKNDAPSPAPAKISMSAAIQSAEQHHHGAAVRAEYEKQKNGQWVYDVEVRAGSSVFDVKIDPEKGSVLASNEDKNDKDDADAGD